MALPKKRKKLEKEPEEIQDASPPKPRRKKATLKETAREIKSAFEIMDTIETAREALDLGAGEYCVKPIDKQELEEKVAGMLAK